MKCTKLTTIAIILSGFSQIGLGFVQSTVDYVKANKELPIPTRLMCEGARDPERARQCQEKNSINMHNSRDLSGADLSNVDLSGADLSNADLTEAILTKANLSRVTMNDATTLSGADLAEANLTDAQRPDPKAKTELRAGFLLNRSVTKIPLDKKWLQDKQAKNVKKVKGIK